MSYKKIRSALVAEWEALNLGLPISYENRKFEPKAGQAWSRFTILPNDAEAVTMGRNGEDEITGLLQVDLFHPVEAGTGAALDIADAVRAAFWVGRRISYQGQEVVIRSSGISPGWEVSASGVSAGTTSTGWHRHTITINFYARAQR